ncbi:SRPBCC family protein [Spirillospora sp. CA-294931]|uniref:SRPBCC family protein n=1 Tax=Spirillospora sp. CA-294931 TaxID=3240042 RepID=UPI003D911EA1
MNKPIEVHWEAEIAGTPEQVWDAITRRAAAWVWEIEYEPREGGSERGLTEGGGTVTVWEPFRHFVTTSLDGTNRLDFALEPRGTGTYLRYRHNGVLDADNYATEDDACRRHTAFYNHSLREYVEHFAGREPVYLEAHAPESSAAGGLARVRAALGVPEDAEVGDKVSLNPEGVEAIEGVIDFVEPAFLGIRTADCFYRLYGRDAWGWPVGFARHHFGGGGPLAGQEAWAAWLNGIFTEAVA